MYRYIRWLLVMGLLLGGLFGRATPLHAVEIPPPGSPIFIQTNGPLADIGLGDWYTSAVNGLGGAYHYFSITIPCGWPRTQAFQIDLYSPEINAYAPLPRPDEVQSLTPDNTVFELYSPDAKLDLPKNPAPGAPGSLIQRTFTPVTDRSEAWERFYTLQAPVRCGTYLLRVETKGDDQNGWRLRFGGDNDANPTNALPLNYDNPDLRPGSGDEPIVGITQTTYQHNESGASRCLTLFQFVRADLPEVAFHNFDLDGNRLVRYYPPSATLDNEGLATSGSYTGTLSLNRSWNGGTQTDRGSGDVIINPEPGWWRIVTCVRDDNQFNQEGQTGVPIFRQPVPEPDMVVVKDDGRTLVEPGELLTYVISFENRALRSRTVPGAAFNVVLRDNLPPDSTFVSCTLLGAGLAGTCAQVGATVAYTLTNPVIAGDRGAVELQVRVNDTAQGQLTNTVRLDYQDLLGNVYPTVRAVDVDTISGSGARAPTITTAKSAVLVRDYNRDGYASPSDVIEYTITVTNTGTDAAAEVLLSDHPDPNTTLLPGTVKPPLGATVVQGNGAADQMVEVQLGLLPVGASAAVLFQVEVNASVPDGVTTIANQGTLRGANFPPRRTDDPRTPVPDDPTKVPYRPPGGGPPTAITLLDLSARRSANATVVRWETGAEIDSTGFLIYRATNAARSTAVQMVYTLIPARGGPMRGFVYTWVDKGAPPEAFYWLVEVEQGGARHEYGPVRATEAPLGTAAQVFLPMIVR